LLLGQDRGRHQKFAVLIPVQNAFHHGRSATSVFPYPTSPHNSRSIGTRPLHIRLDLIDASELVVRTL
jgi:hypothetical protein